MWTHLAALIILITEEHIVVKKVTADKLNMIPTKCHSIKYIMLTLMHVVSRCSNQLTLNFKNFLH